MHHLYLVFVESQVQILVQSLDVLIEVFMFSELLQAKARTLLQLGCNLLQPHSLLLVIHLSFCS